MTETVATQLKAIAFERDIQRLTENFTGREWVFEEIDRWLQQENERFFILTGEPGVGKSAIAARLTQIRDDVAAYHFCRAGDVETVRSGRILRSLAAQLGEHLPDYGHALANTINPVHLRIEVNINIGSMIGSEVTGVYIENLKESDPENELDILIRAPLEKLQTIYAERQQEQPALAIILIDSLDEAVTTTGTNLVKLLTQLSESTSLPSWVRFVMTSRPERRVLRGFKSLKLYELKEKSNESLSDIRWYVNDRVAQPALQNRLQVNQVQLQTLISEITNLSHGNFLYTKLLLNDIEAGQQALDNLAALPKSIDDIYHGFLCRFSEEDWSDRYKPIFGVLTVAQEPISEKQISNFTKIDSEDVRDSIRIVRQFFDTEIEENKETYSIFHQSLRDYLLDKDRNSDFWCNERKQHQRIIDYCKGTSKSWQELERIDVYGLLYLPRHLYASGQKEQLYTLLTDSPNWMNAKSIACGSDTAYVDDLELAIGDFQDPLQPDELLTLVKLYTARQVVHQKLSRYDDTDLETLVWLERKDEALRHAYLRPDNDIKFNALLCIYCALKEKGQPDVTILDKAKDVAYKIESDRQRTEALISLAVVLIQSESANKAKDILKEAETVASEIHDKEEKQTVLGKLAAAYAQAEDFSKTKEFLGEIEAKAFTQAEKAKQAKSIFDEIEKIADTEEGMSKFAVALAEAGYEERAKEVVNKIEGKWHRADTWIKLAAAIAQVTGTEQATIVFDQASKVVSEINDDWARAKLLGRLARALAKARCIDKANEVFSNVRKIPREIEKDEEQIKVLIKLAIALTQAGHPIEANMLSNKVKKITKTNLNDWKQEACRELEEVNRYMFGYRPSPLQSQEDFAVAYALSGDFAKSIEVAHSINDHWERLALLSKLATISAQRENFKRAFSTLGLKGRPSEVLTTFVEWIPAFQKIEVKAEQQLCIKTLREAIGIFRWIDPIWHEVYTKFPSHSKS
jgi:hypothetical protein